MKIKIKSTDPVVPMLLAVKSALDTEKARLEKNTRAEARYYKETCANLETALDQWTRAKPKKK